MIVRQFSRMLLAGAVLAGAVLALTAGAPAGVGTGSAVTPTTPHPAQGGDLSPPGRDTVALTFIN